MTSWARLARLSAALLLLICAVAGRSNATSTIKSRSLHPEAEYRIKVIKGKAPREAVQTLASAPEATRIVVWQVLPEDTTTEDLAALLHWVEGGGVLWFHDSRLAAPLGFKPAPLALKEVPFAKKHKDEYGEVRKMPGCKGLGMAPPGSRHPLLTNVDAVYIFVIEVGEDQYSAVEVTDDQVALLKLEFVSDGPNQRRALAALRTHGKGTVVFKPLLWPEVYTGDRFQSNLLEWSAGFGIPDFTRDQPPAARKPLTAPQQPLLDRALTSSGAQWDCSVVPSTLRLTEAGQPERSVEISEVRQILFRFDGPRDRVTLRDGRVLTGEVHFPEGLRIRRERGEETYEPARLLRLDLATRTKAQP